MGAGGCFSSKSCNQVEALTSKDYGPEGGRSSPSSVAMSQRLAELEALVGQQAKEMKRMELALRDVQRDCRRTVSVLQYNILASYLGQNTQPWFLYGAELSCESRKRLMARFYERDETGKPKNSWPGYAYGILSPQDVRRVEELDAHFRWENRKLRLLEEIQRFDADIISLVELDQYAYFSESLGSTWDSVFHKRPRAASLDGCGLFWRRTKFAMVAKESFDFVDATDAKGGDKRDRSCLMALLEWQACGQMLVVVSTHLAKDPDNRAQTAIRVRQVTQIMESLTDFTVAHGASDAPVVLMGDLNARHFAEIRGLARTVWQIKGSPIHKFLWSASDVPTGPTSVTKARQCRIDVVQFLSSQLEVLEVRPVPKLPAGEVIPNADHPSDHFPVYVRFRLKDDYQKHKDCARSWLECVAGHEKLHPLTQSELDTAFEFFDRDRSSYIHRHDLEEACLDLQCHFHCDVQSLLLDCFPDNQISYANFIRAYEVRLNHDRMRSIGELEYAFQFFANDRPHIQLATLESAFREITPISFSDEEVKEMIGRLGVKDGEDLVDLRSFCEVVCHATFPHKKQRRASTISATGSERRALTKELALRLDNLHKNISSATLSSIASPSYSPVVEEGNRPFLA